MKDKTATDNLVLPFNKSILQKIDLYLRVIMYIET